MSEDFNAKREYVILDDKLRLLNLRVDAVEKAQQKDVADLLEQIKDTNQRLADILTTKRKRYANA